MKSGLPDDVFQVGALMLAKLHFHVGREIPALAVELWDSYKTQIDDPTAIGDLVRAASEIVTHLQEQSHSQPVGLLHCAQYYCMNFDDKGQKRKRGLLGGLWFAPSPNAESRAVRVEALSRKFKAYQVAADAGIDVPMPPDGWRP